MPDELTLEINGQAFGGWTGLTIRRSVDDLAHAFSLSAPFDPASAELRQAFKPFGYQPATVKIDGQVILTGRLENVGASLSAGERALNVQGRSLTGSLVDCAVDGVGYQFKNLRLSEIATRICSPFSIQVAASADAQVDEAIVELGQTAFEFLGRLAQDNGLLLTTDSLGRLVISRANPTAAPSGAIVEGESPIVSISATYDGTARFSRYRVITQMDGNARIEARADDSGVSIYRPTIQTGSEAKASETANAARWRRATALAESIGVSATLSGWRNAAGLLWAPGQIVTLKAPSIFVASEQPFYAAGVDLSLDPNEGRKTELRLIPPQTYTTDEPRRNPWE